jgi:16S rRNA (guanine966-N2)-methyltransferase
VRIIGGEFRGRRLAEVGKGDPSAHLRPTSDRVRESLFNILSSGRFGGGIAGAQVLDLFAGTGALGLEALSRGASVVTFVDDGAVALGLLRKNIDLCRAADRCRVLRRDARRIGDNDAAVHDLVFLDPPYGKRMGEAALAAAIAGGWIAAGALIVWEESLAPTLPVNVTQLDARRYGDTLITLARMG